MGLTTVVSSNPRVAPLTRIAAWHPVHPNNPLLHALAYLPNRHPYPVPSTAAVCCKAPSTAKPHNSSPNHRSPTHFHDALVRHHDTRNQVKSSYLSTSALASLNSVHIKSFTSPELCKFHESFPPTFHGSHDSLYVRTSFSTQFACARGRPCSILPPPPCHSLHT